MKPIPKELQAYFPKAADPARPWWNIGAFSNGLPTLPEWRRSGDAAFWSNPTPADRAVIDKTDPIPPPPILVGQVWAGVGEDGMVAFEILTIGPARDGGAEVYAWGLNVATPVADLIERGYLLRCPYGYAPWSGPEVMP